MKITRKKLRRLILEMAMKGPADLDPYITFEISKDLSQRPLVDSLTGKTFLHNNIEIDMVYMGSKLAGYIHMNQRIDPENPDPMCQPWIVTNAKVSEYVEAVQDTGPLLYDIAMELAGESGLVSDRSGSSVDAARVWIFYAMKRPDVTHRSMKGCNIRSPKYTIGTKHRARYATRIFTRVPGTPSVILALGDRIRYF